MADILNQDEIARIVNQMVDNDEGLKMLAAYEALRKLIEMHNDIYRIPYDYPITDKYGVYDHIEKVYAKRWILSPEKQYSATKLYHNYAKRVLHKDI